MRRIIKAITTKLYIYPIWLIIRYLLFEFPYEYRRGRSIVNGRARQYEWINVFKNRYLGERCFVICNGPSLTKEDYIRLKNEYTFGMNLIYKWFEETGVSTDFLVVQDYNDRAKQMGNDLMQLNKTILFLSDHMFRKYGFSTSAKHMLIPGSLFDVHFPKQLRKFMINNEKLGFAVGGSVVFMCLELAVFMGFEEIYIIGADCSYEGDARKHHAEGLSGHEIDKANVDKYQTHMKINNVKLTNRIVDDYIMAKHYCDRNGIRIYNATRGGKLEVFERVSIDEIVGI